MVNSRQLAGRKGEDAAVAFLKTKGYQIIDRNFRIRDGEIDIIALDQGTLVFVEVKARSSHEFGSPLEAITYYKLRSLTKAAQFYQLKHPQLPQLMRLDAVAITLDENSNIATMDLVKNIS
jgi:putative endonuclease